MQGWLLGAVLKCVCHADKSFRKRKDTSLSGLSRTGEVHLGGLQYDGTEAPADGATQIVDNVCWTLPCP